MSGVAVGLHAHAQRSVQCVITRRYLVVEKQSAGGCVPVHFEAALLAPLAADLLQIGEIRVEFERQLRLGRGHAVVAEYEPLGHAAADTPFDLQLERVLRQRRPARVATLARLVQMATPAVGVG